MALRPKSAGPKSAGPKAGAPKAHTITVRATAVVDETPLPATPATRAPAPPAGGAVEDQIGWVIANQVRARRLEIGQTIVQVADRAGISKGMLSKIENAQASPSLTTLARLATALDMPVTSLFRGLSEERDAVFVKAGHGAEITRQGTRAGHQYQQLGTLRGPRKVMEPLLVTLTERSEIFPLFQHSGIEMLYMLQGVMEYGYGVARYRMERGDVLQFEGDIAHGPTRLVKLPISFLSITVYSGG